jgi:tetratricopeptide (TPR) repeat protein
VNFVDAYRSYEILQLEPGAPPDRVRQAYRNLVKAWHPDRFAGNPRLQRQAEEKLKELNDAYEQLKRLETVLHVGAGSERQGGFFSQGSDRSRRGLVQALIVGVIAWPLLIRSFPIELRRTENKIDFTSIIDENAPLEEIRAKGLDFYTTGDYRKALLHFQKFLAKNPNHVRTWYQVGKSSYKLRNYRNAVHAFQEVIRLKPRYAKAHYGLGRAYIKQQKFDRAVSALQEAIRHNPKYADGYRELGLVYAKLGRVEDSIGALKKAIQLRPTDRDLYYSLLRVSWRIGTRAN